MSIRFTQYLRPHGRQKAIEIDRSEEVERFADSIARMGYEFDIEVLRDGMVSITICDEDGKEYGETVAHELCHNGPEVPEAVDRLVLTAAKRLELEGT